MFSILFFYVLKTKTSNVGGKNNRPICKVQKEFSEGLVSLVLVVFCVFDHVFQSKGCD